MAKDNRIHVDVGLPVPLVSVDQFCSLRLKKQDFDEVWQVIGPTVGRNINRTPLYQLFVICYLQGLENGAQLQKEEQQICQQ